MNFYEILADGDFKVWREMTNKLKTRYAINVIVEPETCMVMARAADGASRNPFFLGEVLITEAVVEFEGRLGYGFAQEDNPEKALCFAILDAAVGLHLQEEPEILRLLTEQEQKITVGRRSESGLVAGTKVNFAVLEG
jgi:alpha-D-ribose 1-methylphosphonate 5-triphosphate synthase subunit PhnG